MTRDLHLEIPNSTLVGGIITSLGAFGVFLGTRFLNNNDDIRKRVNHLEKRVEVIQGNQEKNTASIKELKDGQDAMKDLLRQIMIDQESQKKDVGTITFELTNREGYVHRRMHDIINEINHKNLKDGIVDDIYDKMKNIETLLRNKWKRYY